MSFHNVLALTAARSFVYLVNTGGPWKQVFTSSDLHLRYVRAIAQWPVPDAVAVDSRDESGLTCAVEFKPATSSKAECVRGLGQAITYLSEYQSSALIVPDLADDGFEIARYIASARGVPQEIGVYAYSAAAADASADRVELELLKPVGGSPAARTPSARPEFDVTFWAFWAFWRDNSLDEFFLALDSLDRQTGMPDARVKALESVYSRYRSRETHDPQGQVRHSPNISRQHFTGNLAITLSHLGLWEGDSLSASGRRLVHLGRQFGPMSNRFRNEFARRAFEGRHYDLVKLVYEFQQTRQGAGRSPRAFRDSLEQFL